MLKNTEAELKESVAYKKCGGAEQLQFAYLIHNEHNKNDKGLLCIIIS